MPEFAAAVSNIVGMLGVLVGALLIAGVLLGAFKLCTSKKSLDANGWLLRSFVALMLALALIGAGIWARAKAKQGPAPPVAITAD